MPADELPDWADVGIIDPAGGRTAGTTLDLDAAELADGMPWPPVTVMTFLVEGGLAGVLLEVGPGGLPHRIMAHQARRIGGALVAAPTLQRRQAQPATQVPQRHTATPRPISSAVSLSHTPGRSRRLCSPLSGPPGRRQGRYAVASRPALPWLPPTQMHG